MPATLLGIQDGGPDSTIVVDIPNNCLLVALSGAVDNAAGNFAAGLTVSGGGGSAWVAKVTVGVAGNFKAQCQLSVSEVVTGASGVTLTFNGLGSAISSLQAVWAVTGYDTRNPLGGSIGSSGSFSGAVSMLIPNGGPNRQDITLAGIMHDGSPSGTIAVTPGSDFAEDGEDGSTGNETFGQAQQRTGPSALVTWVDGSAGTMTVNSSAAAAIVIRMPHIDPYVASNAQADISASRSPSLTFPYAPLENDVVFMWTWSTTTASITTPSGWVNVLGGNTDVETDAHEACCVYHIVTAAEAAGATVTFTATNLYDVAETGGVVGCVVRNVDTADVLAGVQTADNSGNATPHILSGVTPDATGGLVLSAVAKDSNGTYTTQPTNWTLDIPSAGQRLAQYDILSVASSAIGNTNITPNAADEYISITVVAKPLGVATNRNVQVLPSTAVQQSHNW